MELGVLSLTDIQADAHGGNAPTAAQRLDDIITYAIRADRLGLDVFGVGEHHTRTFAVSSPAVVMAAMAQVTGRIRLTSAVTVLSTLDPVRVYQDFATLDLISHGRAEIIAGRSAFSEPFALFGEDPANYDALFAEKLDLLLRLRERECVTWSGRFRPPLKDAAIIPRAYVPELPLWVGVGGTPASAERAGRLGLPMTIGLIGGTIHQARRTVDIYREAAAKAGHGSNRIRVGVTSHFYAGEDERTARDTIYPYYRQYLAPKTAGGRGWVVNRPTMDALAQRGNALMVGSPEQIIEKILDLYEVLGADRVYGQIDFGGLPRHRVEASIELYAGNVAPAVRREIGVA